MVVTPACSLPLITWDSRSVAGWHYCCGSVWETRRWWQESTSVKCLCIQTHSLLHPHPLSSPLFRLTQQAYAVPVKFIVRNPQNYFLEKKKKRRRTERRARERLRVRAAGADECFWVCLEKRDWDEARACSLTSMDCSLGNVPANRVCVIVCVGPCVCVHACYTPKQQSTPIMTYNIKVEVFWRGDRDSCHNKIPTINPSSSLSPSCPSLLSFRSRNKVRSLHRSCQYTYGDLWRVHINQSTKSGSVCTKCASVWPMLAFLELNLRSFPELFCLNEPAIFGMKNISSWPILVKAGHHALLSPLSQRRGERFPALFSHGVEAEVVLLLSHFFIFFSLVLCYFFISRSCDSFPASDSTQFVVL